MLNGGNVLPFVAALGIHERDVKVRSSPVGVTMINAYHQAISSARQAGFALQNRLHGWAAIKEGIDTVLVSFFYIEGGQVSAQIVWSGPDPRDSMDLVAHHLNGQAGAGSELVQMLIDVYQASGDSDTLLPMKPCPKGAVLH